MDVTLAATPKGDFWQTEQRRGEVRKHGMVAVAALPAAAAAARGSLVRRIKSNTKRRASWAGTAAVKLPRQNSGVVKRRRGRSPEHDACALPTPFPTRGRCSSFRADAPNYFTIMRYGTVPCIDGIAGTSQSKPARKLNSPLDPNLATKQAPASETRGPK